MQFPEQALGLVDSKSRFACSLMGVLRCGLSRDLGGFDGVSGGFRGFQGVSGGFRGFQGVSGGSRGFQEVPGGSTKFQEASGVFRTGQAVDVSELVCRILQLCCRAQVVSLCLHVCIHIESP